LLAVKFGSTLTANLENDASHRSISISQARLVAGAILIRSPAGAGGIGHVAISQGDGTTVEAHSSARGVTTDKVDGRCWDVAMLVPMISYPDELPTSVFSPPQALVLRSKFPPMQGALIKQLQKALKAKGFEPGDLDGVFGPHTKAAVRGFQLQSGLISDSEGGPTALSKLGL
jgi:N-acetylmuramoyl-L-alanine amidase